MPNPGNDGSSSPKRVRADWLQSEQVLPHLGRLHDGSDVATAGEIGDGCSWSLSDIIAAWRFLRSFSRPQRTFRTVAASRRMPSASSTLWPRTKRRRARRRFLQCNYPIPGVRPRETIAGSRSFLSALRTRLSYHAAPIRWGQDHFLVIRLEVVPTPILPGMEN